jgi:serine/threonine protein kinase
MRLGAYEILLPVARGGMACVWAARQHGARGFSRLVALKTVLPELADPEFESMFLDEARVAARIHHPNVCEIFELIEHRGVLALSMEWVDGETLYSIMNVGEQQPLDVRVAAYIVAQVACGLHAAHELRDENGTPMQLVHRDVSPQNILISRSGHVKVTDFGVAKALGGAREETEVGTVRGKLGYMSPEQADGSPLDRRSDIFSLGIVLYLLTVGAHPFRRRRESKEQQLLRLLVGRFDRPSAIVPGYPPELEAIVLGALSYEREGRFATADELRCRLQGWLAESGPLLTEHHIACVVGERVGKSIQERAERIQRCIALAQHLGRVRAQPGAIADTTFLPTTSTEVESTLTSTLVRLRRARLAAGGLGVAALGLLGALSFGSDSSAPSAAPPRDALQPHRDSIPVVVPSNAARAAASARRMEQANTPPIATALPGSTAAKSNGRAPQRRARPPERASNGPPRRASTPNVEAQRVPEADRAALPAPVRAVPSAAPEALSATAAVRRPHDTRSSASLPKVGPLENEL